MACKYEKLTMKDVLAMICSMLLLAINVYLTYTFWQCGLKINNFHDWITMIHLFVVTATPIIISYYKWSEWKLMLLVIIYSFVVAVIVLIQYEKRKADELSIYDELNDLYGDYQTNKDTINEIQLQLECCGMFSYKEFIARNITLPSTCCQFPDKLDKLECIDKFTHKNGCFEKFELRQIEIRIWQFAIITAGACLPVIEIVLMTLTKIFIKQCSSSPITQKKAANGDVETDSENLV